MSNVIEIEIKKETEGSIVVLKGVITEESSLDELSELADPNVVIDMGGVDRINSYGIRQWINALKKLSEHVPQLAFVKCPPIIVEQFNMISNFGASGKVLSFYLPFYSEDKDDEKLVLFSVNELEGNIEDPEQLIEDIKAKSPELEEYEFNDLEDEYFAFLSGKQSIEFPEDLLKLASKTS